MEVKYLNWLEVNEHYHFFVLLAQIQIRPNGEGISVFAPNLGLHEVYFDRNSWKVTVRWNMTHLGADNDILSSE